MDNLKFRILEQHDGRYIVVLLPRQTGMGWDSKAETIVSFEQDVRSTSTCFAEIAEMMLSSGMYLDYGAEIVYVRYPQT